MVSAMLPIVLGRQGARMAEGWMDYRGASRS